MIKQWIVIIMSAGCIAEAETTDKSPVVSPAKPNILFIMSDDHTSQAVGVYGGRLAGLNPTQTIDSIAIDGMVAIVFA